MKRKRKAAKRVRRVSESQQQWQWAGFDPNDIYDDTDIDLSGLFMRD